MMEEVVSKIFTIRFTEPLLGTVPKDPEVYKRYIETKKPKETLEDESLSVEKMEERGWTGFHLDEEGLFIYDYMIRGFLKTAGEVLGPGLKGKKLSRKGLVETEKLFAIKSKIDKFVFVFPRKLYLGKKEPDGFIERPLRAMTPLGPRVTLVRSDFINPGATLGFRISIIKNLEINMDLVAKLLSYGQFSGLGQFRNGSYGRFEVVKD